MLTTPNIAAQYNTWANKRLHCICAELPGDDLGLDRGAFFGSILGTLNHILLVDILYRERIEGVDSTFRGLDDTLHAELPVLSTHQAEEDQRWMALTKDVDTSRLDESFVFWTLGLDERDRREVPKHIYFTNLAQHQAHHRGQVHNMVSQTGLKPPSLGYIDFRMDMDGTLITTPGEG
jgi:uncharacterized damage-inducible protein DinB